MPDLVNSARDIEVITSRVAELNRHLRDLELSYGRGNVNATLYRTEKRDLEKQLRSVSLETARLGITAREGAMGLQTMGMRMLMVGQFADDVQYGFRGIVNNIPQMVMAFGGGAGLAGAASVLAVGLGQVAQHWGELERLWTGSRVETQAQQMQRLAEATDRTLQQTTQLARLQRQSEVGGKLGGVSEKEGAAVSTAVGKITNTPGGIADLVEKLADRRIEQFGVNSFIDKAMQDALDYAIKNPTIEDPVKMQQAVATEARQNARNYFQAIVERLVNDPTRHKELEELIAKVNPDLAMQIGAPKDAKQAAADRARRFREREGIIGPRQPGGLGEINDIIKQQAEAAQQARQEGFDRLGWSRERRLAEMQAQAASSGASEYAGNRMLELVNNPAFRRHVGAATRADALVAAAETARRDTYRQARLGGATAAQANLMADTAVSQSFNTARDMIDAAARDWPATTKELAASMKESNDYQREFINELRRGIKARWSN